MILFLKKVLLFTCIIVAILVVAFAYRVHRTNSINWELPAEANVLFTGASHVAKGIDANQYPGSVTMGQASERYLFTYLKIKQLLKANEGLDTIFLEFAPTDLQPDADSKYYTANEMSLFLPLYFPLFTKEEWNFYARAAPSRTAGMLLQKVLKKLPANLNAFGKFDPSTKIFDSSNDKHKIAEWLPKGNDVNIRYLHKIVELCKRENIKLFFLYMPMYEPETFYDQQYFYSIYRSQFSDTEFLDYSKLDLPDDYREDEQHLNMHGAQFFTERLVQDLAARDN